MKLKLWKLQSSARKSQSHSVLNPHLSHIYGKSNAGISRYSLPYSDTFCWCWFWKAQIWCLPNRLVLNEILKKINYGEMCGYSLDGKWRNYKDSLKPPHGHAMLMFEDGNRKVMKARRGAMGRCGTRLQCCRAYREDLNVWSCLFSPQHLPSALRPAITHSR